MLCCQLACEDLSWPRGAVCGGMGAEQGTWPAARCHHAANAGEDGRRACHQARSAPDAAGVAAARTSPGRQLPCQIKADRPRDGSSRSRIGTRRAPTTLLLVASPQRIRAAPRPSPPLLPLRPNALHQPVLAPTLPLHRYLQFLRATFPAPASPALSASCRKSDYSYHSSFYFTLYFASSLAVPNLSPRILVLLFPASIPTQL